MSMKHKLTSRVMRVIALAGLVAAPVMLITTAGPASADTSVGDANALATAFGDGSVSVINVTANITLPTGANCDELRRNDSAGGVTINGGGFTIAQDSSCWYRIFRYYGSGTLTFNNVTLTGGTACGAGGAVKSDGPVVVNDSTITDNQALSRWKCYQHNKAASLDADSESYHSSPYGGGVFSATDVTVSNTTFSNNHADDTGGGLSSGGAVSVSGSTFTGNTAGPSAEEAASSDFQTEGRHHCLCSGGGFAAASLSEVHVSGSTFSGNGASCGPVETDSQSNGGCGALGGGFYTEGAAVVSGSTFSGNAAGSWPGVSGTSCEGCGAKGGGFYAPGGADVSSSTLDSNLAACTGYCSATGGGFWTGAEGGKGTSLGSASGDGAFAENHYDASPGPVSVVGSTLSGNSATCDNATCYGTGGGFYTWAPTGVTITASTFNGNTALRYGGAFSTDADLQDVSCGGSNCGPSEPFDTAITNSTITGNTGSESGAIDAYGSTTLTLTYDTIVKNVLVAVPTAEASAEGQQQAVHSAVTETTATNVSTSNDLVAFGTVVAQPGTNGVNCNIDGTTSSDGYNWSDDNTCGLTDATDKQNAGDPGLNALGDWGGPTHTMLPLTPLNGGSVSPLIDAIPIASCQAGSAAGVGTDQRGVTRPQLLGCDIGAVEVQLSEFAILPAEVTLQPKFTG
jgi:hypothetical protein